MAQRHKKLNLESAVLAVDQKNMLLVFSIKERPEVPSLWSNFFPRSVMKWEWDEDGDQRVADLWHLREKISSSRKVIYAKWYQGRATLISKKLFPYLLRTLNSFGKDGHINKINLSIEAQNILQILEENSPISTKELKLLSGLQGRAQEAKYHKALNELWRRLLIVGCGEIDDGAFPSLAMASTKVWFEKEFQMATSLKEESALKKIKALVAEESFLKFFEAQRKKLSLPSASRKLQMKNKKLKKSWISPEDLSLS